MVFWAQNQQRTHHKVGIARPPKAIHTVIYDPEVQTCIFSEIPEDIERQALEGSGSSMAAVVMAADPLAFLRIMH